MGTAVSTVSYTYGDTSWGDLLTGYGGNTVTSDTVGNMTGDGTWTYTWEHGRELASMTGGGTTWSFTYDADGMRTRRTNGSTTYSYVYNGGSLSRMTVGSTTLDFRYDASGTPMTVTYGGTTYYYATNLQGDVVAILDGSGTAVVSYTYDAWGNVLSTTGSLASTLGTHNPLRYRGYVYDTETELYYLQSRYYDPSLGRFLNADAYASTGQGILGHNMSAYCLNNPVSRKDISGTASVDINMTDDPLKDLMDQNEQGGGSGGNSWGSFIRTLQSAADGLSMAMGQKKPSAAENHHMFSNKNKTYTPQYKEIADRYNMLLDARENIIRLEGHSGRHTNAYHNFMLSALTDLNSIANGNPAIFFEGLAIIRGFIRQNPGLPYAKSK